MRTASFLGFFTSGRRSRGRRSDLLKVPIISFRGARGPPRRNLNFWIFRKKQRAVELFISIFENSSPKGSFR